MIPRVWPPGLDCETTVLRFLKVRSRLELGAVTRLGRLRTISDNHGEKSTESGNLGDHMSFHRVEPAVTLSPIELTPPLHKDKLVEYARRSRYRSDKQLQHGWYRKG